MPRFTFRVVGDHIGDRCYWIRKLKLGEKIILVREPHNSYDENAILVRDGSGHDLGYLKKEVAAWFARILDRKEGATSNVHRIRPDGGLVIGIYE